MLKIFNSFNILAYLLADAGYDVWMGNSRGTEASRSHVSLCPNGRKQKEFWSYSWHEIGMYDLSASIDHILSVTNQKKINYVAFSQGTTSFLVLISMRPEYNDKIIEANLLAPVAFLEFHRNPLYHFLTKFYSPLKRALNTLKVYKITLDHGVILEVAEIACKHSKGVSNSKTPFGCKIVLSLLGSSQINCVSYERYNNVLTKENNLTICDFRQGYHTY